MKELSIEQKAARYNEALARARKVYQRGYYISGDIESIFPELKESENEKIRDEDVRKFMQYIEKQAKAYEINLPNRSYDIYAFAKDILTWLEKQGEQKSIEPDGLIEESYQQQADDLLDMVTKKPAWSEEDTC